MFKLESYITPIILSYVEKYAKNLKAESSQFSLWGGDAVFSNLDLRLDVLERELNIPFTFVSGHIHELHIHVPWTRLHADPIVITINTIECVLRLPGDDDSSDSSLKRPSSKKPRTGGDEKIPPPGYVQSLINKIISNISIVCNNLILKYVEEDIVLSLNTRSVQLSSADGNWDPAFIELSLPHLLLRKVLDVSDLTICLDKRNASGKIEVYQEPLLYRCSLKVHIAWIYDSLNAKVPRVSRFEMLCPKLEFSITETQLPMLLRLFHLTLALYFGQLGGHSDCGAVERGPGEEDPERQDECQEGASWSGWAWDVGTTVGTAILPIYWEDDDEEDEEGRQSSLKYDRVLHLGLFVDIASVDLKLTEISKEKRFFGSASHKQSFAPYMKLALQGIFGEVCVKGINSVNFRSGINSFKVVPCGNCPCGNEEKGQEDFYILGGTEDKKGQQYLEGSLFDKDRGSEDGVPPEKRREYNILWDAHMDEVTEEAMLERSGAFAVDYLYYWEIPSDWNSEQLSEMCSDLEYSNLSERALFRTVLGPFVVHFPTGFLHRIDLMREALRYYDYYPYYEFNDPNPFSESKSDPPEEEMDMIQNGSIPVRVYQLTAIQPCFVIFASSPLHNSLARLQGPRDDAILPAVRVSMGYIDLTYTIPMYPFRCAKAISMISDPRTGVLHSCAYASVNANLLDVSLQLCQGERSVTLLSPSKLKGGVRRLLFRRHWKKETLPHWEVTFEVHAFRFRFTKPQILLLTYILLSKGTLWSHEIVRDSLTRKLCSIVASLSGTKVMAARTSSVSSLQLVVDEIGINLLPADPNLGSIPILSREKGHEGDFSKTSPGRASIKSGVPSLFIFQFPNDVQSQSFAAEAPPPIVYCNIAEFYVNFDPTLYEWLQYSAPEKRAFSTLEDVHTEEHVSNRTVSSEVLKKKKRLPESCSSSVYDHLVLSLKDWFPSISGAFIQIKAQGVKAFFPSSSLVGVRSVKDAVKKAMASSQVLLKVSLPNISLENTAHIPIIQQFLTGFPILLPSSLWNPQKDNLPLKIKFNDFSIVDENRGTFFLEPNHLSCTLDLKSMEDLKLNLCMHVDAANAFKFTINSEFLLALTEVVNGLASCLRSLIPLEEAEEEEECDGEDASSSYTPEPISSVRSQSGLFDSGRLLTESLGGSSANLSASTLMEESSQSSSVSLTYWFQCTVPCISVSFVPLDDEDPLLKFEMEDITASLDIQPHYTKLKSRIMSAVMSKSNGEVILSCGETFTPEIKTTDGVNLQIIPHSRLFDSVNFKTQGVFNFTFVRALISNAKWKVFLKKSKALFLNEDVDGSEPRYLSEVYIKLSALDVAFSPIPLSRYLKIFNKSFASLRKRFPGEKAKKASSSYPIDLWINNNTLPLFHFKSKSLRVFCRRENDDEDQDTLYFHVDSINVSSNVDNALSRLLIRPDLYYLAEQCEVLSVMGSKIEDRQYSAHFTGLGVYTGSWKVFIEKSKKSVDIVLKTMEENPALEWNTSEQRQEKNDNEPFFSPILKQFNLQVTYAPAIVYYYASDKKTKVRLIAGHSLEVNAVSDIKLYASLAQIHVCRKILEELGESYTRLSELETEGGECGNSSGVNDSGCESTCSYPQRRRRKVAKFVPLEVLITGSNISMSLFKWGDKKRGLSRKDRYMNRKMDVMREPGLLISEEYIPLDQSLPSEDFLSLPTEEERFHLSPLLFVSIRQPHVFMSINRSSQKLELSVFDLSLESSSSEDFSVETKDKYSLPSESIFMSRWVETKQGDSDPLSGIPPALFTATLSDFLTPHPKLSLRLDRPLKLNINEKNIHRGSDILKQLSLNIPQAREEEGTECLGVSSYLSTFKQARLSTKQILIAHPLSELSAEFFCGLSSLVCEMNSSEYETSKFESSFVNVCLRTGIRGVSSRLLNPWSFQLSSDLTMARWKEDFMLNMKISSNPLVIDLGPNSALALRLVFNYYGQKLKKWRQSNHNKKKSNEKGTTAIPAKAPAKDSPEQHYYTDDLRAGAFKYMSSSPGAKGSDIRPYQAVFTAKTLTWRYPQPRALTRATVYPVPLLAASDLGRSMTKNRVHGGLQYWDLSLKSFRTYADFTLSESEESHLNLPVLSDRKRVAVSPIWRVVLDISSDSQPEEDPSDYVLLEEEKVIVTAKSLVSVLKVDSFFSPELIPKTQISGNVASLSLRIHNHFHLFGRELPSELRDYRFYQSIPLDQIVFNVTLSSISFGLDHWKDKSGGSHLLLRLKSQASISFLDYKFLNSNMLICPSKFQSQVYFFNKSLSDISLHSKPLHLRMGHFLHHSVEVSSAVWNSVLSSGNPPPELASLKMPILTYYIICNHSQSVIRFGQVDTDEALLLKPLEAYMYSWRCPKATKALRIMIEKAVGDWSEPFPLEMGGDNAIRRTSSRGQSFLIHFSRFRLSLKVTISGLIHTASLLQEPLEIKLVPRRKTSSSCNTEEALLQQRILLSPHSVAPSLVMDPGEIEGIKIRILGIGLAWSGTIPTELDDRRRSSVLVRVPTKDKEHCLTLWCRVLRETLDDKPTSSRRLLYIFSPMYSARSLLPDTVSTFLSCKSLPEPFEVSLPGRDALVQFETLGDELQYGISFKICPELPASEPVQISWGMIEKVRQANGENNPQDGEGMSIDDVIAGIPSVKKPRWIESPSDFFTATNQQPKTDVQITFTQLHPLCNTLCVEVRPPLLIVNELLFVKVLFKVEEQDWSLSPQSVFVPPTLSSSFCIGISEDGLEGDYFCSPLQLSSQQDWNIMPKPQGSLSPEGTLQIRIPVREDYVCFLTLSSRMDSERQCRVLRIRSTFNLIQSFPEPLSVASLAGKCTGEVSFVGQTIQGTGEREAVALLYWQVLGGAIDRRYLALSENGKNDWSTPVCLDDFPSEADQRRFIDFPIQESLIANMPLTMTVHKREEVFYIVLLPEERPSLMLHNHLNSSHSLTLKNIFPGEESSTGDVFPCHFTWVSAEKSGYFPLSRGSRPSSYKLQNEELSYIFAALDASAPEESSGVSWSEPLKFSSSNSINEFRIRLPRVGDVKVLIEDIGYTTHILLSSICKEEEIHAKDVRARIEGEVKEEEEKNISSSNTKKKALRPNRNLRQLTTSLPYDLLLISREVSSSPISETQESSNDFQAYVYIEELSFTLTDDTFECGKSSLDEFLKLTLDSVSGTYRPRFDRACVSLDGGISRSSEICLTIFQIQLDNQMFKSNRYDFGIIAVGKSSGEEEEGFGGEEVLEESGVSYRIRSRVKVPVSSRSEYVYEELKKNSLLLCSVRLDNNIRSRDVLIKSLSLSVQPMYLNLEDVLFYKMSEVLGSFRRLNPQPPDELRDVLLSSANVAKYLRLDSLSIDPISVSVSIRAFLKMYIGVHESPLNFGAFTCSYESTDSFALGQSIARHYISGTLFKAGWVVGSLDILGSPTGFTRTVGDGVRDLIAFPYEGSFRGPWAFVSGVLSGSSSLIKHISAGTLTSLTNFASSLSRNLDRLSLDNEHQERNEMTRRASKPSGLGQGILFGLSGVGIGFLGAIGGIAHHPLQALIESGASPTGLIGGVTRGLAGVVTKPLGSAAEFVALTGQGILRGTGWSRDIHPRCQKPPESVGSLEPGELKYAWKILEDCEDVLCLLNAMEEEPSPRRSSHATILLSSEAVFLVYNDSQVVTVHSLLSLEMVLYPEDPNKFSLLHIQQPLNIDEEERHKNERVTQFVLSLCGQTPRNAQIPSVNEEKCIQNNFIGAPTAIEYFSALFELSKRQKSKKGFDSL